MAVAAQTLFIAHGFGHGLSEGNAHVFHRVVAVDVQVAHALDVQVYQAVAGDLVEHVVKKANAGGQIGLASAVEVDLDGDFGLGGVARNFSDAIDHIFLPFVLSLPEEGIATSAKRTVSVAN